ncbi:YceI family protein [Rhodococcus sp. BP-349]|uniref:YceI family protein n=1 Tax=unclassified Rhodococcus (in: high G+C Gram-positive bacteria) TaxID=192944 RepID=UPI001C9B032E|nr:MULTISPECIES: YceI family protein [unclassified Rhodococcus (in: high G+C Gram-positive bacteria)]MBY6537146.1 YceI family protein [Rhodococcus sp. BP-363]MBY6541483.1 YceI family protein [Rhodococcus sp. BP-369]MBY6560713.1 YceI family protein [Rhodococcus sp. BP-370]MBY6575005.1 YceI family protein [Rhodococcus sp. BP-364]MBY6584306.1 YceI family protein [Rhodococcus sp. BP-358]
MKKKWWITGAVVVVLAIVALVVGPRIYSSIESSDPAASVSTSGAEAATGDLDGEWTVTPGDSANPTSAGYTVAEVLNGTDVTVVGTTPDVSGSATIANQQLTAGEIVVQTETITTDSDRRDNQFRGNIFDVANNPTATFTVTSPVDLSTVPTDGTTATVTLDGTLTLKGQTRDVSVETQVLRSGETIVASGNISATWTDYGIEPPSLGFVTVDPTGSVDFLVTLGKA